MLTSLSMLTSTISRSRRQVLDQTISGPSKTGNSLVENRPSRPTIIIDVRCRRLEGHHHTTVKHRPTHLRKTYSAGIKLQLICISSSWRSSLIVVSRCTLNSYTHTHTHTLNQRNNKNRTVIREEAASPSQNEQERIISTNIEISKNSRMGGGLLTNIRTAGEYYLVIILSVLRKPILCRNYAVMKVTGTVYSVTDYSNSV